MTSSKINEQVSTVVSVMIMSVCLGISYFNMVFKVSWYITFELKFPTKQNKTVAEGTLILKVIPLGFLLRSISCYKLFRLVKLDYNFLSSCIYIVRLTVEIKRNEAPTSKPPTSKRSPKIKLEWRRKRLLNLLQYSN